MAAPEPVHPADDPADLAALAEHAATLLRAVEGALPAWVRRTVAERWTAWSGRALPPEVEQTAIDAATGAVAEVVPALRALLETDVDAQRTNPLSIIRGAVRHPTAVLRAAGVPPVERDAQAERLFPDDPYDLTPGAFRDLGDEVHEPGLVWGAAKAHVVLRRRRHDNPPR